LQFVLPFTVLICSLGLYNNLWQCTYACSGLWTLLGLIFIANIKSHMFTQIFSKLLLVEALEGTYLYTSVKMWWSGIWKFLLTNVMFKSTHIMDPPRPKTCSLFIHTFVPTPSSNIYKGHVGSGFRVYVWVFSLLNFFLFFPLSKILGVTIKKSPTYRPLLNPLIYGQPMQDGSLLIWNEIEHNGLPKNPQEFLGSQKKKTSSEIFWRWIIQIK